MPASGLFAGTHPCVPSCPRTDTRPYAEGWRCADHTPAARAGQPEPDATRYCAPGRCYCNQPGCPARRSYGRGLDPIRDTIIDFRAAASGRRRSSPGQLEEARKQVRQPRRGAA